MDGEPKKDQHASDISDKSSDADFVPDEEESDASDNHDAYDDEQSDDEDESRVEEAKRKEEERKNRAAALWDELNSGSPVVTSEKSSSQSRQGSATTGQAPRSARDAGLSWLNEIHKPLATSSSSSSMATKPTSSDGTSGVASALATFLQKKRTVEEKRAFGTGASQVEFAGQKIAVESLDEIVKSLGKKKKISTLDKSRLDWDKFKATNELDDELERHKKTGGYIGKVQFLQRANLREYELERDARQRKRR